MRLLSKDLMRERNFFIYSNKDVKKRKATIHFEFHGKLNGFRRIIEMMEEKVIGLKMIIVIGHLEFTFLLSKERMIKSPGS